MCNGHRSSYFDSYVGVRQGENLSPMLFALFLNHIESFSLNMKCNTSLQRNLDILKSYCDSNNLKVNMSKTKVVVFSKSKLRLRNLDFQIW